MSAIPSSRTGKKISILSPATVLYNGKTAVLLPCGDILKNDYRRKAQGLTVRGLCSDPGPAVRAEAR